MERKIPQTIEDVKMLLQQAEINGKSVYTRENEWRSEAEDGIEIDFSHWTRIREVDCANVTVTVERNATLGEIEDAVNAHGLHFAAMTEDLRMIPIGQFYAEQLLSLTNVAYTQPRFQVLGLEVLLLDGTVLTIAGKTVKNVTGYDMCRCYISNRETLAIPLAFTLKLISKEPEEILLGATVEHTDQLLSFVRKLRETQCTPNVFLYWNAAAEQWVNQRGKGQIFIVISGTTRSVQKKIKQLQEIAELLSISLQDIKEKKHIWDGIAKLREKTIWKNAYKIPTMRCDRMLQELDHRQIGCWYTPLEGALQLIPKTDDKEVYLQLLALAEALGGCGNWYDCYRYGVENEMETTLWKRIKKKFDPKGRLNPWKEGDCSNGKK